MSKLNLIITGWPRGGLGYITELLRRSGVDVGQTFDESTSIRNIEERLQNAKEIEVSPFLVPWLGRKKLKDIRVIFITRDPMRILNSFHFHGLFHEEKMSAAKQRAYRVFPNFEAIYKSKPTQAAAAYIVKWHDMAVTLCPNLIKLPVEENPNHLLSVILPKQVITAPFCPPTVNSSNCRQVLVPSQLPENTGKTMLSLLMKLGYHHRFWYPCGGHAHYTNADWHC